MQHARWSDISCFLAVLRAGSYRAAARQMGIDATTAARRVKALEAALGETLLRPGGAGGFVATEAGLRVRGVAEGMERFATQLDAPARRAVPTTVRLTSVPLLINRLLLPRVAASGLEDLCVTLELVPDARNLSLTRREADLALRLGRPLQGGADVLAQRIGALPQGVYGVPNRAAAWIGYEPAYAHLPHAQWIEARVADGDPSAPIRVCDADTALSAARSGLGRAVLPCAVGDAEPELVRYEGDPPMREAWMLSHVADRGQSAVEEVKAWLRGLFEGV